MSDETITIEIPVALAHEMEGGRIQLAPHHKAISDICRAALAKHKVDARAERLGLPWVAGSNYCRLLTRRGSINFYNQTQRDLVASAPDLAQVLEACMEFLIERGYTEGLPESALAALKKAGWRDG